VSGSLALWAAGAVVALCGAFCYVELSVRVSRSGSEYAFAHAAYPPIVAFLIAWSVLLSAPAAMAAVARAFADYFAFLWPLEETGRRVLAASAIATLASIAMFSTVAGARIATAAATGKLLALLGIAIAGLLVAAPAPAVLPAGISPSGLSRFGPAMVAIIWAYDGFQSTAVLAGEVRTPQRTLPIGLILGLGIVAVAYIGLNVVYFRVLGLAGVAGSDAVAAQTLAAAVGSQGARIIAALVMMSTFGTVAAQAVGYPRYLFAPADDRLFPSWLARVSPRRATPANAIATLAAVAIVLVALGGYSRLINISVLVNYPLIVVALFGAAILRRTRGVPVGFSMPLYPMPLIVFSAGIAMAVTASIMNDAGALFYAAGVPISGALVYALRRRL
jgi:APA family basic amino acid/polyamine antiporter